MHACLWKKLTSRLRSMQCNIDAFFIHMASVGSSNNTEINLKCRLKLINVQNYSVSFIERQTNQVVHCLVRESRFYANNHVFYFESILYAFIQ